MELLARVFPDEYGRPEIAPQVEQERPPTLPKVVLNTNDKTLEEITNFPMDDPAPQPDAPKPKPDDAKPKQRVPVVGIGGKVIRWTDAPERDADPEEADLR